MTPTLNDLKGDLTWAKEDLGFVREDIKRLLASEQTYLKEIARIEQVIAQLKGKGKAKKR